MALGVKDRVNMLGASGEGFSPQTIAAMIGSNVSDVIDVLTRPAAAPADPFGAAGAIPLTQKGVASGVGTLDSGGHQPLSELSPSVAVVSSPTTFTAALSVKNNGAAIATFDASNNPLAKLVPTSTGNNTFAGQLALYSANAEDTINHLSWYVAIDITGGAGSLPYRNLAIGYSTMSGGSAVQHDLLYAVNWGAGNDPTFNYGASASFGSVRHRFRGPTLNTTPGVIPGLGMGTAVFHREANQVGPILAVQTSDAPDGAYRWVVRWPSGLNDLQQVMRGDSTSANPLFVVEDRNGTFPVQTVTLGTPAAAFTLTLPAELGGGTTASIPATADHFAVQAAILATTGILGQQVTVAGNAGGPYTIQGTKQATMGAISITGGGSGAAVVNTTPGVANVEQLRVTSQGKIQWASDASAILSRSAAGTLNMTGKLITGGAVAIGSGTTALATCDVAPQSGDATFRLKAPTNSATLTVTSSNSALTVTAFTNATSFALGTNGAANITMGASGQLGLFGHAAIAQPARVGQLTDSSGGASGGATIAPVTDIASAANAIATLAAKVNALELLPHNIGLTA